MKFAEAFDLVRLPAETKQIGADCGFEPNVHGRVGRSRHD